MSQKALQKLFLLYFTVLLFYLAHSLRVPRDVINYLMPFSESSTNDYSGSILSLLATPLTLCCCIFFYAFAAAFSQPLHFNNGFLLALACLLAAQVPLFTYGLLSIDQKIPLSNGWQQVRLLSAAT